MSLKVGNAFVELIYENIPVTSPSPFQLTDLVTCFEMFPSGKVKIIIQCFFNLTQTQVNYGKENKGKFFWLL